MSAHTSALNGDSGGYNHDECDQEKFRELRHAQEHVL